MAWTIWETMIPGIVSDELGPATTMEGPCIEVSVISSSNSWRSRTTSPESFLHNRSKNSESISQSVQVAVSIDSCCFKTRHFRRSQPRPVRTNANQRLDLKSVGVNAQFVNTILTYANVPVGGIGIARSKENPYQE